MVSLLLYHHHHHEHLKRHHLHISDGHVSGCWIVSNTFFLTRSRCFPLIWWVSSSLLLTFLWNILWDVFKFLEVKNLMHYRKLKKVVWRPINVYYSGGLLESCWSRQNFRNTSEIKLQNIKIVTHNLSCKTKTCSMTFLFYCKSCSLGKKVENNKHSSAMQPPDKTSICSAT